MPRSAQPGTVFFEAPLRRGSGGSLHHQVYLVLRSAIVSGQYAAGERLPSEEELCRRFEVARITVRTALEALKKEALVETRRGSGTTVKHLLVREKVLVANVDLMKHLQWVIASTSARLLSIQTIHPSAELCHFFGCTHDAALQRISRLRFEGGRPLFHVTTILAPWIAALSDKDARRHSLFEVLSERGIVPAGGRQVLSATAADPGLAKHFGAAVGAPLVFLKRFQYDRDHRPMQYLEIRALPEYFEVEMTLSEAEPGH